jgi:hypothetical protein
VSFLESLAPAAREELAAFVDERVRQALAARARAEVQQQWVTTAQAGVLLSRTANAIRCRLQRGWLQGDAVKDGGDWLIRRSALLEELDRRAAP